MGRTAPWYHPNYMQIAYHFDFLNAENGTAHRGAVRKIESARTKNFPEVFQPENLFSVRCFTMHKLCTKNIKFQFIIMLFSVIVK